MATNLTDTLTCSAHLPSGETCTHKASFTVDTSASERSGYRLACDQHLSHIVRWVDSLTYEVDYVRVYPIA